MDIEEPNCFMLPCLRQRHGRQCSEASAAGEWARSIQIPRGTEKPHRSMSSNRSFSRRSQLASHVINWLDATLCLKRTEVTRHCIQQDEMGTKTLPRSYRTVDQMAHQRCRSESYCNCIMCVRITDAVHAVCTSARFMYVCEYRVLPNVPR